MNLIDALPNNGKSTVMQIIFLFLQNFYARPSSDNICTGGSKLNILVISKLKKYLIVQLRIILFTLHSVTIYCVSFSIP